ncbi:hypothetical protein GIB67_042621 [Kingdonia uniflora]|uniref:Uncharacterized protein n=1 Tax=Kingdonia uniflora TaxID=39325 RepID=A0A7J7M1E4_9MAGN|nr:hypothetical protein GIB67_042621 [Kingdonia uniflora]
MGQHTEIILYLGFTSPSYGLNIGIPRTVTCVNETVGRGRSASCDLYVSHESTAK